MFCTDNLKWQFPDNVRDRQSSEHSARTPANPSPSLDCGERALQCLINGTTSRDEATSLIEAVFLSKKAIDRIAHLRGSEAQAFIDAANEV